MLEAAASRPMADLDEKIDQLESSQVEYVKERR
jgi:hypothetical protein